MATVSAWALVLTAPGMGLLLILLVMTAATSVYVLPLRAGFVVVALNTGVIVAVTVQVCRGRDRKRHIRRLLPVHPAGHVAQFGHADPRAGRMRRELAEAHVELQAASVLLSESARTPPNGCGSPVNCTTSSATS